MTSQPDQDSISEIPADVTSLLKELERLGKNCRVGERGDKETTRSSRANSIAVRGR